MMQKNLKIYLFGLLALLTVATVQAAVEDNIKRIQQSLDQLAVSEIAAEQEQKPLLQKTLSALKNQQQLSQRISELQVELEQQPAVLQRLERNLARQALDTPTIPDNIADNELEKSETNTNAKLLELNRTRAEYRQAESQAELRQKNIREQLTRLQVETEIVDKQLGVDYAELVAEMQAARFAEHNLRIQALELELLLLPKRAQIAKLNGQLLQMRSDRQSRYLEALVELRQARQRAEAERTLRALEKSAAADQNIPQIRLIREENQQLTEQLRAVLTDIDRYDQQRRAEQLRLAQLTSSFNLIRQQLELEVSQITTDQIQFIFENRIAQDTGRVLQEIAQLRLEATQLEQRLNEPANLLDEAHKTIGLNRQQRQAYESFRTDQSRLLSQLLEAQGQLRTILNQMLSVQRQINQQINNNRESISRHLLWNPVTPTLSAGWFNEIGIAFGQVYQRWIGRSEIPLLHTNEKTLSRSVLFVLILCLLMWLRRYVNDRRPLWARQIGNVVQDRLTHTFKMVLLGPLLTLYVPALFIILGRNLVNPQHSGSEQALDMLNVAALLGWFFMTMREWLKAPDGLFCTHFGMNENLCLLLRRLCWVAVLVGVPLILFHNYIWSVDSDEMRSGLVRLVVFLLLATIGSILMQLWRFVPQLNQITRSKSWWVRAELWLSLFIAVDLGLIVLTAMGYTFTVNLILYAGFQLLVLLLLTFIFYKLGLRLVLISERRLEFDRAKARRAEMLAARENPDEEPPLETNYLNMQTISDHARTLLKTATVVVMAMLIWGE